MNPKKSGLGRGLSSLIPDKPKAPEAAPVAPAAPAAPVAAPSGEPRRVPVSAIEPNPFQPRQTFAPEALAELVASIKEKGILTPLLVRPNGAGFQLIAGERRFRSAIEAGLATVPVIVKELTDQESLEIALIENLQRQDLNVIEEAEGYRHLMEKFNLTQEEVSRKVGKARASVANALRLLNLAPRTRQYLRDGQISTGHAKVLMAVELAEDQEMIAATVVAEGLSVRELEKLTATGPVGARGAKKPRAERSDIPEAHLKRVIEVIQQRLGTSIRLTPTRTLANGKRAPGRLEVDFFSPDDLDRLLGILGVKDEF